MPPLKWPRSVIQEDEHTEPSSAWFENSVDTSVGKAVKPARSDCEGLCWNLAARRLGEKPHAGSHSAGPFSSSFGSFTQPCTQWLHKADYKLQRIPEGAKSDAGANEPREPLIPVTEWDKLGKAWTTQIQGSPGSRKPALGTGGHYPPYSAGPGDPGGRARPARAGALPPARTGDGGNPAGRCGQAGAQGAGLCVCTNLCSGGPVSTLVGTREKEHASRPRGAWAVRNFCRRPGCTATFQPVPPGHGHPAPGSLCALCPQPTFPIGPLSCPSGSAAPQGATPGWTVTARVEWGRRGTGPSSKSVRMAEDAFAASLGSRGSSLPESLTSSPRAQGPATWCCGRQKEKGSASRSARGKRDCGSGTRGREGRSGGER
nr:collagen alpha-1(I) chain-like isoform X2 [Gorilla gorilla gorilla]